MGPKKKDTGAGPDPEKRRITPRKWNPVPKDDSSSSDDDIEICPICNDKNDPNNEDNKNRMIGCDGCDKWFHWGCVGISNENKPAKDDDWFCRKCARLKDSAGAWKPAKGDESQLDVLPARTTSRISRGGSKSEVKRGRGGRLRGGKRESFVTSKSVGGTPRSPSPPEVILTPVKNNQKKEKSKKVSSDLFGSKSSVNISKDQPNSKLPTGLSMTPIKPKGGATLTPVKPHVTLSPTEKNDGITVTSVKRGITVTPSKGITVTPSKGNTVTPSKNQRIKKVVAAPENQKKSSITLGTITDSDGSGSDIDDILPGTNEGLQNSTISSSGSDQQDHEIIKIDEKKAEDKVIVIQDLDSEDETEQKSAKFSNKKSGRVTPLKIDMKKINKSPKEKDNKRKECPELKSPVSKKARGNNSDSKVSLSSKDSNQSIASILDSVEEESLILEGRNSKSKEDLNNVEKEFTHDIDLGDPGLQNMLENIGSVDDGVGSLDNKTSDDMTEAEMLDSVDLDKLEDDVLSDKNLDDLLNISDNTDSEKSGRIAFEKSANFETEKSTHDSLKKSGFSDMTGNTAHVDNNTDDTASKTVNCDRNLIGENSLTDNNKEENRRANSTDNTAANSTDNTAVNTKATINTILANNSKNIVVSKQTLNNEIKNNPSATEMTPNKWSNNANDIRDIISKDWSDDNIVNGSNGEEVIDCFDESKGPDSAPKKIKKKFSWEVDDKTESYGDHMYYRKEGVAASMDQTARHNLPQTVDKPNTFTKLQELMQQNSGITPTKDSSKDMSALNQNLVSPGHHNNISSRLSRDSEPLTPLTISDPSFGMKTSTTAISSVGLTNTETSQSHNSKNLSVYPFTSSHTNQTLGPNSIPQDPRGALLSHGRADDITRVQGQTDIDKPADPLSNNQQTSTRKNLEGLFSSSQRNNSFSSISSDSGCSGTGQLSPALSRAGQLSPATTKPGQQNQAPVRFGSPINLTNQKFEENVSQRNKEPITGPIRPPSSSLPLRQFQISGVHASQPTSQPQQRTVPLPSSNVSSSFTVSTSAISLTSSTSSFSAQFPGPVLPRTTIISIMVEKQPNVTVTSTALSTSTSLSSSGYMYPLCSRLAPPPPLPPLVPVSTPITVQSIPQQNLLQTGNTISVTNITENPNLQSNSQNDASQPRRNSAPLSGRIQIASNLQANSAILSNENIHQAGSTSSHTPSYTLPNNISTDNQISPQLIYQMPSDGGQGQVWANSPTAINIQDTTSTINIQSAQVLQTTSDYQPPFQQPLNSGQQQPTILQPAPNMRGAVRGPRPGMNGPGMARGVRPTNLHPRIRPPRGTGPRIRGGLMRGGPRPNSPRGRGGGRPPRRGLAGARMRGANPRGGGPGVIVRQPGSIIQGLRQPGVSQGPRHPSTQGARLPGAGQPNQPLRGPQQQQHLNVNYQQQQGGQQQLAYTSPSGQASVPIQQQPPPAQVAGPGRVGSTGNRDSAGRSSAPALSAGRSPAPALTAGRSPAPVIPVEEPPLIKIEDDEDEITMIGEVTPTPEKQKAMERLRQIGGLTIVRQTENPPPPKPKTIRNLNLPPGISVSPAVEESNTNSRPRGPSIERAGSSGSSSSNSNDPPPSNSTAPSQQFLDLNKLGPEKIAQLKALGIL